MVNNTLVVDNPMRVSDSDLSAVLSQRQISRRLEHLYGTFYEIGRPNNFIESIEDGVSALPALFEIISNLDGQSQDKRDSQKSKRIDAWLAIGQIFTRFGAPQNFLNPLVNYSQDIIEDGIGPERHAALFALGQSQDTQLMDNFVVVLGAESPAMVNVASFLMGYSKWKPANDFLVWLAANGGKERAPAAIWSLGQIGDASSVAPLLGLLRRGMHVEWIVGALGDLGSVDALEDLAALLNHQQADIRLSAVSSIRAIAEQNKNFKSRREWRWLYGCLQRTAHDNFPPTAVIAMAILADLGETISPSILLGALHKSS